MLRNHRPEYGSDRYGLRSPACVVCASRGFPNVRHKHFSSVYQQQVCVDGGRTTMECPVCQSVHSVIRHAPRVKAIFSSSTMAGWYTSDLWQGSGNYHVDVETMGGAKIMQGRKMWETIYGSVVKGVDTHVVFGLNDLISLINLPVNSRLNLPPGQEIQRKVDIFMSRLESWYDATRQHRLRHNLDQPNRFSVSNLLRPPQLYRAPGNKSQDWATHNTLVDEINKSINQFNMMIRTEQGEILGGAESFPVVISLKNVGWRKNSSGKQQHAWKLWRELDPCQKLHLVPDEQAKVMNRIVKFLKLNTPNGYGQYVVANQQIG